MKIYLCHTPLHVLLSALSKPGEDRENSLFAVVEDTPGLHHIAREFLQPVGGEFLMLPGTASTRSPREALKLQKANASTVRRSISGLPLTAAAVFYDLRAEAQALLNYALKPSTFVSCVEDGLLLYKVARPFSRSLTRRWRNKVRFGMKWKESRFIGRHPAIDEFCCLYPDMLRSDLRSKPYQQLPHVLGDRFQERFRALYGNPRYDEPFGIIVLPHPETGISRLDLHRFVELSSSRCVSRGVEPVFKVHPRDVITRELLINAYPGSRFISQEYPVELVLYAEPQAQLITGVRTSALHVTKALHQGVECFYYEPDRTDSATTEWRAFFKHLGICPLGSDPA
ncbi:hypothetical protein [Frateuria sp. YIM B11624]|uniref:hypothetical protein n=1 Tax=Frateuria sp. YIM B11624 TaxID=3143185 RepID=UPI003C78EE2C